MFWVTIFFSKTGTSGRVDEESTTAGGKIVGDEPPPPQAVRKNILSQRTNFVMG